MDNTRKVNPDLEVFAWGLLMVWWGLRWWPLESLPDGTGLVGTALILLGLNAVRLLKGIPTRSFTTLLGLLALMFGGILLINSTLQLPFELPIFEIMLITVGTILLAHAFIKQEMRVKPRGR